MNANGVAHKTDWRFWLAWVGVNSLTPGVLAARIEDTAPDAFIAKNIITILSGYYAALIEVPFKMIFSGEDPDLITIVIVMALYIFPFAVLLIGSIGIGQWLVLRWRSAIGARWLWVTSLFAFIILFISVYVNIKGEFTFYDDAIPFDVVFQVLGYLFLFTAQMLVLRRAYRQYGWWFVASVIAVLLMYGMAKAISDFQLDSENLNKTIILPFFLPGAIYGAVTGPALLRILRHPREPALSSEPETEAGKDRKQMKEKLINTLRDPRVPLLMFLSLLVGAALTTFVLAYLSNCINCPEDEAAPPAISTEAEQPSTGEVPITTTNAPGSTRTNPLPPGSEIRLGNVLITIEKVVRLGDVVLDEETIFEPDEDQEILTLYLNVACQGTPDDKCTLQTLLLKIVGSSGFARASLFGFGLEYFDFIEFYGGASRTMEASFIVGKDETDFVFVFDNYYVEGLTTIYIALPEPELVE